MYGKDKEILILLKLKNYKMKYKLNIENQMILYLLFNKNNKIDSKLIYKHKDYFNHNMLNLNNNKLDHLHKLDHLFKLDHLVQIIMLDKDHLDNNLK